MHRRRSIILVIHQNNFDLVLWLLFLLWNLVDNALFWFNIIFIFKDKFLNFYSFLNFLGFFYFWPISTKFFSFSSVIALKWFLTFFVFFSNLVLSFLIFNYLSNFNHFLNISSQFHLWICFSYPNMFAPL